jgi:lipoate-protein ligase A
MALDEALLDLVAGGHEPAYLRTYGWTIPTLSLGYFQQLALVRADPRFASVPLVRRLTGGGAIWHHHELTYALVVPASHPLARPSTRLYQAVHQAIVEALVGLGIHAKLRGAIVASPQSERRRPLLCFTDPNPDDIVSENLKIVGSAQRRRAGAVLQHGSVLLARSWGTPELPGLSDLTDASPDPEYWSAKLLEGVPGALGLEGMHGDIPDQILRRATQLERAVYRNCRWTELR